MKFSQPDTRFAVSVGVSDGPRRHYVFAHIHNRKPPHTADWKEIDGASVYLVGAVDDALSGLIQNYTNKELDELIGISPTTLRTIRQHLGIAADGGHGGRRPGAGGPKKES